MEWVCLATVEFSLQNLTYADQLIFLKMMDFQKGEWCNTMDGLYWRFIDKNRDFFLKNPRLSMMVRILDKMKSERKKRSLNVLRSLSKKILLTNGS